MDIHINRVIAWPAQRKAGKNPVFFAKNIPGLKNTECWGEDEEHVTKELNKK